MAYRLLMLDFDGVLADSFPFSGTPSISWPPTMAFARWRPTNCWRCAAAAATDCPPCWPAVVEAAARGAALYAIDAGRAGQRALVCRRGGLAGCPAGRRPAGAGQLEQPRQCDAQRGRGGWRALPRWNAAARCWSKAQRLRQVLRRLHIAPEHAAYLGDQPADGDAAQCAGWTLSPSAGATPAWTACAPASRR